jgi:hypothetical protein
MSLGLPGASSSKPPYQTTDRFDLRRWRKIILVT